MYICIYVYMCICIYSRKPFCSTFPIFCANLRKTFPNCHPPRKPLLQGVASHIEFNTTFVALTEVKLHLTGCMIISIFNTTFVVLNFYTLSHPNPLKSLHLRSTRTPQTGIFFHFSAQNRDILPFFFAKSGQIAIFLRHSAQKISAQMHRDSRARYV